MGAGAFREEELTKKAVKDFKEQLESCDIESLVRMKEAGDDSKLFVKDFVCQGTTHEASENK